MYLCDCKNQKSSRNFSEIIKNAHPGPASRTPLGSIWPCTESRLSVAAPPPTVSLGRGNCCGFVVVGHMREICAPGGGHCNISLQWAGKMLWRKCQNKSLRNLSCPVQDPSWGSFSHERPSFFLFRRHRTLIEFYVVLIRIIYSFKGKFGVFPAL